VNIYHIKTVKNTHGGNPFNAATKRIKDGGLIVLSKPPRNFATYFWTQKS